MAMINRLIAEAKHGPIVTVKAHEVRKVAEHMRKLGPAGRTADEYVELLLAGKVQMLGSPVLVLPA